MSGKTEDVLVTGAKANDQERFCIVANTKSQPTKHGMNLDDAQKPVHCSLATACTIDPN
jgi:hypothetical protein